MDETTITPAEVAQASNNIEAQEGSAAETTAATTAAEKTTAAGDSAKEMSAAETATARHSYNSRETAEALDINELQALGPEEFDALCARLNFRVQPGRTHHQHILDIVRYAWLAAAR